jgi:hypothetical protein
VFFDFNNDGLLDLFVTNVGVYTRNEKGRGGFSWATGRFPAGFIHAQRTKHSLSNKGGGKFEDVSTKMGLEHRGWSGDAMRLRRE